MKKIEGGEGGGVGGGGVQKSFSRKLPTIFLENDQGNIFFINKCYQHTNLSSTFTSDIPKTSISIIILALL